MAELSRRTFLQRSGAALALASPLFAAQVEAAPTRVEVDPHWHLVARLGYGPRPYEVARARALGAEAYLEDQLSPKEPGSEPGSDWAKRLEALPLLTMDRKTLYGLDGYRERCYETLIEAAVMRAVHSPHQLYERMVEFWSDHFNVPADADITPDIILFQREVIRRHALGRFRDLLLGVAQSPAMLSYLDNDSNVKDHPNENWARELLELHTLGVDGGYSEDDVKDVARAFTGWTIHDKTASGFYFDPGAHDRAAKHVLGHDLPAERGIEDGLHVLGLLANHPSTARYLATKLCRRFVSDEPDAALVDAVAQVWTETGGDIKALLRTLFGSEVFKRAYGQKLRRPFDFFVGALRATGTDIDAFWVMHDSLEALGQLPYGWHPPDGYPDRASAWLSTNGLLRRWNTAMHLTHGAHSDPDWDWGVRSHLHKRTPEASNVGELVRGVSEEVFGAVLEGSLEPFVAYASDGAGEQEPVSAHLLARKLASLYGLMLASPQFQWY